MLFQGSAPSVTVHLSVPLQPPLRRHFDGKLMAVVMATAAGQDWGGHCPPALGVLVLPRAPALPGDTSALTRDTSQCASQPDRLLFPPCKASEQFGVCQLPGPEGNPLKGVRLPKDTSLRNNLSRDPRASINTSSPAGEPRQEQHCRLSASSLTTTLSR